MPDLNDTKQEAGTVSNSSSTDLLDYYIFTRRKTNGEIHAVWYRPNSQGYTTDIDEAGRFAAPEAKMIEKSSGGELVAVSEEEMMKLPRRLVIPAEHGMRLTPSFV